MKKVLILTVMILTIVTISNAQDIGATIGANFTNVAGDDAGETSSKFNLTLGLFAEFMVADQIGIQPEIVLSGQGYKFDQDDGSGNTIVEWKQKLGYINFPILVNYYVSDNFCLQGGPYLGILNSAEQNVSGSLGVLGGKNKDSFESSDFGMAIGAVFKSDKMNVGLRYQLGLSDIAPNSDIKNRVFNISLGFRIVEN